MINMMFRDIQYEQLDSYVAAHAAIHHQLYHRIVIAIATDLYMYAAETH